jgi:hypothetical protein
MTDNDDSADPRDRPSRSGAFDHERPEDARARGARAGDPASSAKGAHAAPTDPEVPSAKRRGALRRQRSLIGLVAVVVGLLSITLALLYRASRSVGSPDASARRFESESRADYDASTAVDTSENAVPAPALAIPTARPLPDLPEHSTDVRAPAFDSTAPASKNPPPAIDIIRTPSF